MDTHYKTLMDTIRIGCINCEEELAGTLRAFLNRPGEAKKVLRNVFSAPGSIQVNEDKIVISIDMVGEANEKIAVRSLFERVNSARYTLPGDQARPIVFKSQSR